jgi:hypothetical protein
MKGKMIWARMPARFGGGKLCGFVKNVARDIINRNIKITLTKGDEYIFREPGIITSTNEGILFLYGKVHGDESDEILFEELDKVGGDVETVINNITNEVLSGVEFKVRDVDDKGKAVSRRKGRKNRTVKKSKSTPKKSKGGAKSKKKQKRNDRKSKQKSRKK